MIEKFIESYSRFDRRLRRINRQRIMVKNVDGGKYVSCTFYGVKYGQFYPEKS